MNTRDKIRKLEAVTEARGATPAEAETARRLAGRLRKDQETPRAPGITIVFTDPFGLRVDSGSVFDAMGAWRP